MGLHDVLQPQTCFYRMSEAVQWIGWKDQGGDQVSGWCYWMTVVERLHELHHTLWDCLWVGLLE